MVGSGSKQNLGAGSPQYLRSLYENYADRDRELLRHEVGMLNERLDLIDKHC